MFDYNSLGGEFAISVLGLLNLLMFLNSFGCGLLAGVTLWLPATPGMQFGEISDREFLWSMTAIVFVFTCLSLGQVINPLGFWVFGGATGILVGGSRLSSS